MRIISGQYRGRHLQPPTSLGIRPTTDLAREALFNRLQHQVALSGLRVLDLFGGSGAISLEFLSRGAQQVTTVEQQRKAVQHMQRIRQAWQIEGWQIVQQRVEAYLAQPPRPVFDLVFLDPPYALADKARLVRQSLGLLEPDGLCILEHPSAEVYEGMKCFVEKRIYGQSAFSHFRPDPADAPALPEGNKPE